MMFLGTLLTGNYLMFYNAIREAYPDIQMISNCDGSSEPLPHPAELYDFHVSLFHSNWFVFSPYLIFTRIL
jgi:alpha-N-arabinofuranosidase